MDDELPDYATYSTDQLRTLVRSYGLKPSTSKPHLIRVLIDIWHSLHPVVLSSGSEGEGRGTEPIVIGDSSEDERVSPLEGPLIDHQQSEEDLWPIFRRMVVEEEELWLRILRYEVRSLVFFFPSFFL